MIITRTPFRMSFFGGGTDIPEYFMGHKGSVISTTFDKYCYVTVRHLPRFFDYRDSIVYSKMEKVSKISEIQHPLVRETMKYLNMHELSINYDADLPARTGLGTSSAFAVGLLQSFHALKGEYVDKNTLAKEAIHIERELCKEDGGWQDQIATSFGGFNRIDFEDDVFSVSPIVIEPKKKALLNSNLMLFYTGISRVSADVQKSLRENIENKRRTLDEMYSLVDEAQKIITDRYSDIDEFGRLLDYAWNIKRSTAEKVSTSEIDLLYDRAKAKGALGGKLLGAGGGGFLLFYVKKELQDIIKDELKELLYIPFEFETEGSQILYYKAEEYNLKDKFVD